MQPTYFNRKASLIYLLLVPFLATAFGFGVGKIHYSIYLPVWIINVVLMGFAAWVLGLHVLNRNAEQKHLVMGAFFLVAPWILISMFFGLGPPPENAAGWVETGVEQQVRYSMLTAAGVFIVLGFSFLKEELKARGENYFSLLSYTLMMLAIPLFILDMLFWGFTLTDSFRILVSTSAEKLPEWFNPLRVLFGMVSVVEVALTYLAVVFLAVSLHRAGHLGKTSSRIYILVSLVAFVLIILSAYLPEPFVTAGFAVSIPAAPFLMPYFIGVHLLRKAGDSVVH